MENDKILFAALTATLANESAVNLTCKLYEKITEACALFDMDDHESAYEKFQEIATDLKKIVEHERTRDEILGIER
jgi:hypothetical protein